MDALAQERIKQREERQAVLSALTTIAGGIAKVFSEQTEATSKVKFFGLLHFCGTKKQSLVTCTLTVCVNEPLWCV